jgi:hypothetical protein
VVSLSQLAATRSFVYLQSWARSEGLHRGAGGATGHFTRVVIGGLRAFLFELKWQPDHTKNGTGVVGQGWKDEAGGGGSA